MKKPTSRSKSAGPRRRAVRIRLGGASDLKFLAENHRAMAWETERRKLAPAVVRRGTRAVVDDPSRGFYLVADLDGKPAGQLLVTREWSDWRDGDFWWVQSVFVRPEFRRCGVYRMLHAAISVLAAHAPNVRGLRLYAARTNLAAQRTYRKLGMKQTPYVVYEQVVGSSRG